MPSEDENGWPEYKRSVLQQLEFLTREVSEIKESVHKIDKDLSQCPTTATCASIHGALQSKLEALVIWKANMEGKASTSHRVSWIAVTISGVVALITIIKMLGGL